MGDAASRHNDLDLGFRVLIFTFADRQEAYAAGAAALGPAPRSPHPPAQFPILGLGIKQVSWLCEWNTGPGIGESFQGGPR